MIFHAARYIPPGVSLARQLPPRPCRRCAESFTPNSPNHRYCAACQGPHQTEHNTELNRKMRAKRRAAKAASKE